MEHHTWKGTSTPSRCAFRSESHWLRAANICVRSAGTNDFGSMTTRSLPPFASRTMMTLRSKSTSLIRRRMPSMSRMPVPYSKRANSAVCPFMFAKTQATSSLVRTLGMRRLCAGRLMSFSHGRSMNSTSR